LWTRCLKTVDCVIAIGCLKNLFTITVIHTCNCKRTETWSFNVEFEVLSAVISYRLKDSLSTFRSIALLHHSNVFRQTRIND
jgi:hypothetical protein